MTARIYLMIGSGRRPCTIGCPMSRLKKLSCALSDVVISSTGVLESVIQYPHHILLYWYWSSCTRSMHSPQDISMHGKGVTSKNIIRYDIDSSTFIGWLEWGVQLHSGYKQSTIELEYCTQYANLRNACVRHKHLTRQ